MVVLIVCFNGPRCYFHYIFSTILKAYYHQQLINCVYVENVVGGNWPHRSLSPDSGQVLSVVGGNWPHRSLSPDSGQVLSGID